MQPSSVASGTSGMMGMQLGTVGSPAAVMGGAVPGMMGLPVNSAHMMGMQPTMMGLPRQPNMCGMQPGMSQQQQQQVMMGMQAGMMGMPVYQQNMMGVQPGMMQQSGLMGSQQKANMSFDEL